jgi:hypothetical protein
LRAWYSYNRCLRYRVKETRIPKALKPNLLLAGLFRDEDVDTRLGNYLASILERFADKKILAQIASDHVKKAIRYIDDINNSSRVAMTIGALWPPI